MTKKCLGCGIFLQTEDQNKLGFTPNLKNDLCVRCFKLKNYNVLINESINMTTEDILTSINRENAFVLFATDFLNLTQKVIKIFKAINKNKALVITKADLIPRNIKADDLLLNIKNIYHIEEEIFLCSSKNLKNLNVLRNKCLKEKKVIVAGFTNAGKSSLINALVGSDITVSKKKNTTQDFIKTKLDDAIIIDAPGFSLDDVKMESLPKNIIKPLTYQLSAKYYLNIGEFKLSCQNDSNLTIYVNNEIGVEKRKKLEAENYNIQIPSKSDLVIEGLGFIRFTKSGYIALNTDNFEIRPSIVGGMNE